MRAAALAAALALTAAGFAAPPPAPLAARFAGLATPPLTQMATLTAFGFSWEGLQFYFENGGQMAMGGVDGRMTTAVFSGRGVFKIGPPAGPAWRRTLEQGQMLRFLGRDLIEGGIKQAVFRFADPSLWMRALDNHASFTKREVPSDLRHILEDRAHEDERRGDDGLALLAQAMARPAPGLLLEVECETVDGKWIELRFDPAEAQPLTVAGEEKQDEPPAIWTQYAPADFRPLPRWRASDYALRATARHDAELEASAAFTLTGAAELGRGAIVLLDPRLRVSRASAPWYQPAAPADWVYVELPRAADGAGVTLQMTYSGKALEPAPTGHDWITPSLWYPAPAAAEIEAPTRFRLNVSADQRVMLESDTSVPVRSAGFALGEDVLDQRAVTLADGQTVAVRMAVGNHNDPKALTALAGTKLVDILSFLASLTGARPYAQVGLSVSGAPENSPLPGLVSFDPQMFAGLSPLTTQFAPALSAAAQWWGASLAPASPHDEWLIAGLRQLSALMYQQSRYGDQASLATVELWRQYLLNRQDRRTTQLSTGPLWLGAARLTSPRDDGEALLEAKGGAELYMLRQMMWQPQSPAPDAAFSALLHDLMRRYASRQITNAEFQALVEAHMTPAMDLEHNHKMDWFFEPLLYGTNLPTVSFHADEKTTAKGEQVAMTIENPGHWRGLLPVYIFRDREHWIRGLMPVTSDHPTLTVPVPFKPQYVEANYLDDMLIQVRQ